MAALCVLNYFDPFFIASLATSTGAVPPGYRPSAAVAAAPANRSQTWLPSGRRPYLRSPRFWSKSANEGIPPIFWYDVHQLRFLGILWSAKEYHKAKGCLRKSLPTCSNKAMPWMSWTRATHHPVHQTQALHLRVELDLLFRPPFAPSCLVRAGWAIWSSLLATN